jgi:hypothetical protein
MFANWKKRLGKEGTRIPSGDMMEMRTAEPAVLPQKSRAGGEPTFREDATKAGLPVLRRVPNNRRDACSTRRRKDTGGTPAPLRGESAFAKASARHTGPIYVSAKRTHFIFEHFLMYQIYLQELMQFAEGFANGFVLEKRTDLEGCFGVN